MWADMGFHWKVITPKGGLHLSSENAIPGCPQIRKFHFCVFPLPEAHSWGIGSNSLSFGVLSLRDSSGMLSLSQWALGSSSQSLKALEAPLSTLPDLQWVCLMLRAGHMATGGSTLQRGTAWTPGTLAEFQTPGGMFHCFIQKGPRSLLPPWFRTSCLCQERRDN
jgi:hypothetical protein